MPPTVERRLVILAEGNFGFHHGKTAMGVIRYGHDKVLAVIDSTQAGRNVREWLGDSGRNDIPIVASLNDALGFLPRANALLIGIAPTGGKLPDAWREVDPRRDPVRPRRARRAAHVPRRRPGVRGGGADVGRAADRLPAAARAHGHHRRPPPPARERVVLTVGTDCAIGKMSVGFELRRAAQAAGRSAVFVATGQTGMMVEGWGVTVDRVAADFLQGTVEWLVEDGESRGDWVLVEGQGSLDHPAYSSVTLGLIHGATPHAMVMVHKPGMAEHDFDHLPEARFPIASLRPFIALHEQVAGLIAPSKVVAVALNTSLIADDDEARRIVAATAAETGLPCDDPVRFGGDAAVARDRGGPSTRCRGSCTAARRGGRRPGRGPHDLRPPPADAAAAAARPVRHRAVVARRGPVAITTVVADAARRRRRPRRAGRDGRGVPGPLLRRHARDDGGRGCPRCSTSIEPVAADLRGDPDDVRAALEDAAGLMAAAIAHHGAAKCALDIALHDLAGKRLACRSGRCWASTAELPPTDFTLGIDEPAVVAERARRAADFPALKIKVGGPTDLETLEAVRAVFAGPIRVDANTGWTPRRRRGLLPELERLGRGAHRAAVPRPPARPARAGSRSGRSLPLVADESAVTIEDLDALVGVTAGVNVKLAKCGGVGPRERMLERARELGFRTFLGCMEETSIGIAASAAVVAARRLGGPRRLPPARRGPGARPGDRAGQALAAARRARPRARRCGRRGHRPESRHGDRASTASVVGRPVHRPLRAVDKSVGQMVEKPLPATRPFTA